MLMSSIKKRPPGPFDLLGFAIFVSTIRSALLILSWKVLITRPSAPDITIEYLKKIKIIATTATRSNHTSCPLEKALAYQDHPKNLITDYSLIQETRPRCCMFAVLNITIKGFFMARSRQLFCYFHFTSARMLDGLLFPLFFSCHPYSNPAYTRLCLPDKITPMIKIFCVRIKPVYLNQSLHKTHNLTYCYNATPGGQ